MLWCLRDVSDGDKGDNADTFCCLYAIAQENSLLDAYREQMKDMIRKEVNKELPLQGLKVIVNAGNGSGGFLADMLTEVGEERNDGVAFFSSAYRILFAARCSYLLRCFVMACRALTSHTVLFQWHCVSFRFSAQYSRRDVWYIQHYGLRVLEHVRLRGALLPLCDALGNFLPWNVTYVHMCSFVTVRAP